MRTLDSCMHTFAPCHQSNSALVNRLRWFATGSDSAHFSYNSAASSRFPSRFFSLLASLLCRSEFSGERLASGLDALSLSAGGNIHDSDDKDDKAMSGEEGREEAPMDSLLASTAEPGGGGRSRGHQASGFLAHLQITDVFVRWVGLSSLAGVHISGQRCADVGVVRVNFVSSRI